MKRIRNNEEQVTAKSQNRFAKIASELLGAVVLILALPFVLTGASRFPFIGLGFGIVAGFFGIASLVTNNGKTETPLGIIIVSVGLIVFSILCVAGFICSFKPELFKGRHGSNGLN